MKKPEHPFSGPISWGGHTSAISNVEPRRAVLLQPAGYSLDKPVQSSWQVASLGVTGAAIYLLAFLHPTLGLLGFFAIAPWAWLVIDARHIRWVGYAFLYACGLCQWLGLRLLAAGSEGLWVNPSDLFLIAYLAVYLPFFVSIGRFGRETLRTPITLWLPVVWVGLSCLQANLFGGFSLGSLAHAVVYLPDVIQIADLFGSYGLSALMVATGAALVQLFWTFRRVRFLERKLSPEDDTDISKSIGLNSRLTTATPRDDERGFTSASKFRPLARPVNGNGTPVNSCVNSQQSMKLAVRRNRDAARDRDLAIAAFSTLGITATIIWSAWYSQYRISEASKWKLFEGYRYEVHAVGGEVSGDAFQAALKKSTDRGLVTYASTDSSKTFRGDVSHSVLAISPKSIDTTTAVGQGSGDHDAQRWVATLRRYSGQFSAHDLGYSLGEGRWKTLYRHLAAIPVAFPRDEQDVKIRLLPMLAYGSTIEQTMNDSLHAYIEYGKSIDGVVVVLEPSFFDGSRWPRLTSRSVIVAATANRCPVIAVIPDHDSFVAAGDGSTFAASAVGTSESAVVSFTAMIDPRDSLYTATGEWPGWLSFLCCMAVIIYKLINLLHSRKIRELNVSTASAKTSGSEKTSTVPVPITVDRDSVLSQHESTGVSQ